MEVSRVELIGKSTSLNETEKFPYTLFSLNPSEQSLYDSFRAKHHNLEILIDELKNKGLEKEKEEEKKKGEEELEKMFLELVNPYVQNQGLEASGCFTTYSTLKGLPRQTFLHMPCYLLFENKKPFNVSIEPKFLFLTENENLFSESHLSYTKENDDVSGRHVLYDLLEKITEGREQDGITFPMISCSSFLYFASTDFAMPLMSFIKNILDKIGPAEMDKLSILFREYLNQRSETLQREVFREAYQNRLEKAVKIYELVNQPIRASDII